MRTTINIEERALEICKQKATESGQTLGEVITAAILDVYSGRPSKPRQHKYQVRTSGGGGLQPGVNLDNSVGLQDVMDGVA